MQSLTTSLIFLLIAFVYANPLIAQEANKPPEGYTALFNGTDLEGWHGLGHFRPITLAAMSDE